MTQPQSDISFVSSSLDSIPDAHLFSHNAMATVFEVIIIHGDSRYVQQAAWAAFDELDKLERQLSRFIENSDVSRVNNLAAGLPLQLSLEAFECLKLCCYLYDQTGGAFDVTVGSLMGCWLDEDKAIQCPSEEQLNIVRQRTGLHLIELDEVEHTISLLASPVQIDLGGIGKGYAIDKMAELLNDWGIDTALINGGCSSVFAFGKPIDTKGWHLTLSNPANQKQVLNHLYLQDRSVSGSGLLKGRHIIDPRTARPVAGKRAAWVCAPTAAVADALSTAFMIMSPEQVSEYCSNHPETFAMVAAEDGNGGEKVERYGLWE
ncbi:MAG: FAD:protein FMN transferase [Phycisphaerae bacterium]|nr:FAD:protein FMN transferase [Phycisphaerae bacterium]